MNFAKLNNDDICTEVFNFAIDISNGYNIKIDENYNAEHLVGMKYNRITGKFEKTEVVKMSDSQLTIMEAMAEQYEQNLENRLNDQEVQATIYEAVLTLSEGSVTK